MKILHFILILTLIAAPSGAIWLFLDSQRDTEHTGLFGDIRVEISTKRVPPIFWEAPISVEETTTTPAATLEIIPENAIDQIKNEIFSDILEATEEPADLPVEPLLEVEDSSGG